jgi:radical SAM protein with 4Fe4S-binding SPASM domain
MVTASTYGEFTQKLANSIDRLRHVGDSIPSSCSIEVTHRCPLACLHCYNNLPMDDHQARGRELTFQEHCGILDQLSDLGCLWLLYTGGEIFARRDFPDIYRYAKRKGFIITLFTNGTLITPRIADYLAENRPFSIEITLYGRTKETYERLTGIPGSFDRCMHGIELLLERKLPLKLKTVAVSVNHHEVWDIRRFAVEELGLEFKFDAMMNPRLDCSQSPLAVRLTPEEIVTMDLQDPARLSEWRALADRGQLPEGAGDEIYHCGGGINGFAIDPSGRMSICSLSQFDTYDLRRGTLAEGWKTFIAKVRHKKATRLTKCSECGIKSICGMCPANAELENGDPEAPVDFLCHTAHLRASVFDIPIRPHGDCEYCEGGIRHKELEQSANAMKAAESSLTLRRYLPVVSSSSCGAGGCSSCH